MRFYNMCWAVLFVFVWTPNHIKQLLVYVYVYIEYFKSWLLIIFRLGNIKLQVCIDYAQSQSAQTNSEFIHTNCQAMQSAAI